MLIVLGIREKNCPGAAVMSPPPKKNGTPSAFERVPWWGDGFSESPPQFLRFQPKATTPAITRTSAGCAASACVAAAASAQYALQGTPSPGCSPPGSCGLGADPRGGWTVSQRLLCDPPSHQSPAPRYRACFVGNTLTRETYDHIIRSRQTESPNHFLF